MAPSAPAARAQSTRFDFESPGLDQQGAYQPDPAVTLTGGVAALEEQQSPAWYSPGWGFRLGVRLVNPGTETLINYPVRITLDGATALLFDEARLDGADLLPVLISTGAEVTERWLEDFDFISRTGSLWVRLSGLPPGTTQLLLYFGNPTWDRPGTAEAFFADPGGWTSACVVSPLAAAETLTVESFVDSNTVRLAGTSSSVALDAREVASFAPADLSASTCLTGSGAFYGTFTGEDGDALAPMTFAATRFVAPSVRYEDRFDVLSPFGTAQVQVLDGGSVLTTATVDATTPQTIQADAADGDVIRVESDLPVLVVHHAWYATGTVDYDTYVMVPPARDLTGVCTGTCYLVAAEDATQATIYYSAGTRQTVTLDRTTQAVLSGAGTQGDGDAVRVVATGPVMATSHGDGDGGEAISFLPTRELGRRHVVPQAAEYLQVATRRPVTTCVLLDAAGVELSRQTSNTYGQAYPDRLRFTAVPAGAELSCDAPVFAIMEDLATNTERNLWPIKLHRPRVHPEPTALLATLDPRFEATRGAVVTPTFVAPFAVAEWTGFLETATEPPGTQLRYQLSSDGGSSWRFFDGSAWANAATDDDANPWWQIHQNMDTFDATPNQLTVRAILASDLGDVTPTLDDLEIYYRQADQADHLEFDPIASPQVAGQPFPVTLRAVDALGRRIGTFEGTAYVQTLHGQTSPSETPRFDAGQVLFDIAVTETGPDVQLYAFAPGVSGTSDPFEVLTAQGARIEYLSGDQQFGPAGTQLPEPLVVQVLDDQGAPAGGVTVTFAVTSGDGSLIGPAPAGGGGDPPSGPEISVPTDALGRLAVTWLLGPRTGAQRAEARLSGAQGSPVPFVARADPNPDLPHNQLRGEGGGCSCRAGVPAPTDPAPLDPSLLLWLLPLGALLRHRRRALGR